MSITVQKRLCVVFIRHSDDTLFEVENVDMDSVTYLQNHVTFCRIHETEGKHKLEEYCIPYASIKRFSYLEQS